MATQKNFNEIISLIEKNILEFGVEFVNENLSDFVDILHNLFSDFDKVDLKIKLSLVLLKLNKKNNSIVTGEPKTIENEPKKRKIEEENTEPKTIQIEENIVTVEPKTIENEPKKRKTQVTWGKKNDCLQDFQPGDIIISKDVDYKNAKTFMLIKMDELEDFIMSHELSKRAFYECFSVGKNMPCKFYVDCDIKGEYFPNVEFYNAIVYNTIEKIKDLFDTYLNISLKDSNFLTECGNYKDVMNVS